MPDLSFNFINTMKKNILTKVLSLFTIFAMTFNVVLAQVVEDQSVIDPQEEVCESQTLVSTGGENGAVAVDPTHPAWTASIDGAEWVWTSEPLDPTIDSFQIFSRTFTINGDPADSTLEIASDNYYKVTVNGDELFIDSDEDNYSVKDTHTILAVNLLSGPNTIEFKVSNKAEVDGTLESNPAGVIYKLTVNCTPSEPVEPVCTAGNLISNGGFELPDVTNGSGWELFSAGTDWDVAWLSPTGDAPEQANLEIHGGVNGWLASEGVQYAELDTDYGSPAGGSASVKISQEINTSIGMEYTISYDFSPRPNTSAEENEIIVRVNGGPVDSQGPVAGAGVNAWATYTVDFTATSETTVIPFEDAGTPNSQGTFLDNISVRCDGEVPPPPVCEPIDFISENGRNGMVKVEKVNPRWVKTIPGTNAKWVWNNASIPVFPDRQDGGVFTVNESVTIVGNPEDSVIKIAADNVYSVVVNGDTVYAYSDNPSLTPGDIENIPSGASKFSVVHEHAIPASFLNTGLNTIEIRAVNQKWPAVLSSADTATNPAGLMYALTVNEDCDDDSTTPNEPNITFCHVPDGNNENPQTMTLPEGAANAHLNNHDGDYPGECQQPTTPTDDDPNPEVIVQENSQSRSSSSGSRASGGGAVLGVSTEGEVLGACVPFAMYHKKGDVGGEVAKIQEFLNEQINAGLTVDGVYGETTVKAVHDFQQKYFEQVISPWVPSFMARTTGKWYKTTRMMANKIIDCPEAPVYLEDPKIIYEVKWEKSQSN